MKVAVLPYFDANPYQRQLATHLSTHKVRMDGYPVTKYYLPLMLHDGRPDILHVHWIHPYFFAPSFWKTVIKFLIYYGQLLVLRAAGTKIVWTVHNLKNHDSLYPKFDHMACLFMGHLSDRLIAHCEEAKRSLLTTYKIRNPQKCTVIPHGNYVDSYENKITTKQSRAELGIDQSKLVFLFLGLIRPYKGVLDLVQCFKRLPNEETELIITGKALDHDQIELIQNNIQDISNIHFIPGYIPDEKIQVYMNCSDVVVFPYRDILTSGAVLLAMSFGRACIAPSRGCIPETLNSSGGFLYDADSEDGLECAMKKALDCRSDLPQMGIYNRRHVDQWGWDYIASNTLAVYKKVNGQ